MDKDSVILILGEKTGEIRDILEKHYYTSVSVLDAFRTPSEFYKAYHNTPLRVSRILILEDSFIGNPVEELNAFRKSIDSNFIKFNQAVFLLSNNKEAAELINFISEDFFDPSRIRRFHHELYTVQLLIDYTLRRVSKKYYEKEDTQYEEVVRKRVDAVGTFRLDEEDSTDYDRLVVLDKNVGASKELQSKLTALTSLSNIVKDETWTDNKILRDLSKLRSMVDAVQDHQKFEIDYSVFQASDYIRTTKSNTFIVTGQRRSGKSCAAYGVAKSASRKYKVLLVELDVHNLGLSFLAESIADVSTVLLLQNFKEDFKNSLYTLANSNNKLNLIAGNIKTLQELEGLDIPSFINFIVNSASKYFDKVIFDLPFDSISEYLPLIRDCEKLIITAPTLVSQIVSTLRSVRDSMYQEEMLSRDVVLFPTDMFRSIKGIKTLRRSQIRELADNLLEKKVSVLAEVELKSFDVDESLYLAIDGIKEGEVL